MAVDVDERIARREQIIAVATPLFSRFGYARTTMADIARHGHISRPTLYAEFADKDAVFDAVIGAMTDELIATIAANDNTSDPIRERLAGACTRWVDAGYDLVLANPEAADLFDPTFPAVRASNAVFERLLAGLLSTAGAASMAGVTSAAIATEGTTRTPEVDAPTAADLAELMTLSLQGFKRFATSRAHLDTLVDILVRVTCASPIAP